MFMKFLIGLDLVAQTDTDFIKEPWTSTKIIKRTLDGTKT